MTLHLLIAILSTILGVIIGTRLERSRPTPTPNDFKTHGQHLGAQLVTKSPTTAIKRLKPTEPENRLLREGDQPKDKPKHHPDNKARRRKPDPHLRYEPPFGAF